MVAKTGSKKVQKKSGFFQTLLKGLLWTACFLALLLALDQLALRLQPTTPLLRDLQRDYREFRSRLWSPPERQPLTIEAVIDRDLAPQTTAKPSATPPSKEPSKQTQPPKQTSEPTSPAAAKPHKAPTKSERYLYVDAEGELQFADRLEDIPPALREGAQALKE